jgi:hypothetical protein
VHTPIAGRVSRSVHGSQKGVMALVYQGITYTSRETVIGLGPVHATADRHKTLPLPPRVAFRN